MAALPVTDLKKVPTLIQSLVNQSSTIVLWSLAYLYDFGPLRGFSSFENNEATLHHY